MKKKIFNGLASLILPLGAYANIAPAGAYNAGQRSYLRSGPAASMTLDTSRIAVNADNLTTEAEPQGQLTLTQGQPVRELMVIDSAVPDKQVFYREARPGVEIVEIDSSQPGLSQLVEALGPYKNLSALHIVSHAQDGVLLLGNSRITAENIKYEIEAFAALNGALREGGDLLLYGCDLARSDAGVELLDIVQRNTHLDLAASSNLTGDYTKAGDWNLEIRRGEIESSLPFSGKAIADFSNVLAGTFTLQDFGYTTGGEYANTGCPTDRADYTWNYNSLSQADYIGCGFMHNNGYVGGTTIGLRNDFGGGSPAFLEILSGFAMEGQATVSGTNHIEIRNDTNAFQLTNVVADEFAGSTIFSDVWITGYVEGGGEITSGHITTDGSSVSTFTFDSANALSNFVGVNLTKFRLSFINQTGSSVDYMRLVSFTTADPVYNTAPTLTTITPLTGATEDIPFTISYADLAAAANEADADGDTLSFRVEAVSTGTLTKNSTAVTPGVTLLASGEELVWTPAVNANGTLSAFTVRAWDGAAVSSSAVQVQAAVVAVNDDPAATGVPATVTVTEDTASNLDLSATTLSDVDAGSGTVTLTLAASGGILTASSGGGVTVSGSGTGTMDLSGTAANLDTYLNTASNIQYTGPLNANGTNIASITLTANDGGNTGTGGGGSVALGTVQVDITAVNDPSGATNLTQTVTYTEDPGGAVALGDIVVSDFDAGDTITATLTLNDTSAGSLTTGTFGSATSTYNAGTGVWTVTGSTADVNAALAAVAFTPSPNWDQDASITTRIRDAANSGPADGLITLDVTPVNDTPTDIALSSTSINQSSTAAAAVVGTLSTTDPDIGDTHTYALVTNGASDSGSCGAGNDDNASFQIDNANDELETTGNLESGSYSVCVQASDGTGSYQKAFAITVADDVAPSGHSVSFFDDGTINGTEATGISFTFADAEVGADYSYTISSSGGGTNVTGTGAIATATDQISGIDVSGLGDGTLTLSVTLTDGAGNSASAVTDTATLDASAPSGHSVSFDDGTLNSTEASSTSFTFAGAEVGTDYSYTISSSGGGTPVTGTGTITSAGQQISGIDGSGLADGTLTLSVTLTDTAGNAAGAVTDTATLDSAPPSGHSASFDDGTVNGTEATSTSFTFAGAEVGADYSYTISSSGGGTNVTGTGTIATATDQISGIDVSGLSDGTLTLSVTLTDTAGNAATAVTDTATLDSAAPSGHSVSFDQTNVNDGNHTAISFSFTAAEVGASYDYTISSSAGGTAVTGSGTVVSVGQMISGIDVSGLNDGTLTLSVTLTDTTGNAATAVTDTISKDANAPEVDTVAVTDGDFAEGDTVTVTVTLTEDVTVAGGSPTLSIDIGATTRQATMTGEVGGVLTFSYTVQASDNTDGTGVTVQASSIDLTGGITVRDAGGNDADLSFNQVSNANAQVDTVLPADPVVTDPAGALDVNTPDYELAGTHGEDGVVINLYADDDNDGVSDDTTVLVSTSVSGGAWAVTHTLTANSDNNFVVVAEDAAGNLSAAVDVPTITHDNVAPAAPAAPDLEAASDSGISDTDDLTNATTPEISGTAEANATVTLSSDLDGEVGTATADGSGDWTLTTTTLSDGVHSLTVIATDAAGNDSAASPALAVTVDTTGPSLSALADQRLVLGNSTGPLPFTLGDNVTDPAAVTLTPASSDTTVVPLGNIVLGGSDGTRTVEITGAAFGVSSVDIEAVDEAGNNAIETLQVRINTPPAINGSGARTLEAGTSYSFTPSASDVDGDTLTFSISNRPSWASFNTATGRLSGTPSSSGSFSGITISVNDGLASTALAPFTINVSSAANTPPVISGTPPTQVTVGEHYHFAPTASDADGDSLSFSASGLPPWLLFDAATGSLSGMPGDAQVGTHGNIVISASDGTDTTALAAFSITVAPGEDSDGDGVSDYQEGLDETDPNDPEDYVDSDAPQLTAPAPQVFNAEGLFTALTLRQLLGLEADADEVALSAALAALATDQVDGEDCCTPSVQGMNEGRLRLRPGRQVVTWVATDRKGNEALAEQTVDVRPLVSFGKERQVGEGGTATIPVLLNGPAPVYPFTVPYVIDPASTADAADHNLTSGNVTFTETEGVPQVRAEILVDTFLDESTEGDETVILRLDNSSGSEPPAADAEADIHNINVGRGGFQLTISEANLAPQAQLQLWQAETTTAQVAQAGGEVTLAATINDPNPLDSPTLSWTGTDTVLLDLAEEGENQLIFDPATLTPGAYRVRVVSTDNAGASGSAMLDFVVLAEPPVLSADEDSDGDGLSDAEEGNGDSNGNGIPDYLDPGFVSNVLPLQVVEPDRHLAECEPGTACRLGRVALTGTGGGILLGDDDLADQAIDADPTYEPVGGIFDFEIDGLPSAGLSAEIVLPLTEAIPAEAVYRKYLDGEWVDFTEDSRNSLASAPGEPGYCPSPILPVWEEGLNEGDYCLRLQIEDGGPNDADGEANSAIADPGAVSIVREDNGGVDGGGNGGGDGGNGGGSGGGGSSSGGGSGGGGAIGLWWLPLLLAARLRRRRKGIDTV